jgi:hypothetical protein
MGAPKTSGKPVTVSVIPRAMDDHPNRKTFEDYLAERREKSLRARLLDDIWRDPDAPSFAGALAYQMRGGHMYRTGVAMSFSPVASKWNPTTIDAIGKLAHLGERSGRSLIGALMDYADRVEGPWENFNIVQPVHPVAKFFGYQEETLKQSIARLEDMGATVKAARDPVYIDQLDYKLRRHPMVLMSFGENVSKVILKNHRDATARMTEIAAKNFQQEESGTLGPVLDAVWELEAGVEIAVPPTVYLKLRREPK